MSGKKYNAIKEKIGTQPMGFAAAAQILIEHSAAKFDQTVELHINLGVDAKKSEQTVRGSVSLPHGTPKQKKVVVLSGTAAKQKAALAAGAVKAGGEELIDEIIKHGGIDADVIVATPDMMPKIAKAAKILGPKGLMPNPKNGTVTPDPDKAVAELAGGKISFKMDTSGNIHEGIAKISWDAAKVVANAQALLQAVKAARPGNQRGEYIKKIVLKSTMSPAIQIVI
ncbi:MAG: 50S ribosomal protein L1 [Candidatus Sungbacteria bacterium]|nr:50S ribosomal protein L1 [Candidatus Sungbacteria bacterium]